MIELGYNETNLEEYLTADPIQEVYNEVSGSLTPHLPLWLTVLTSIFLVMTFLVLVCVIWDNHRKRRARHERDVNRERFVQASRLRNFDTDNPQFVNLMRLLWDGPLAHKQIDSINFPMLTIDGLVSIQGVQLPDSDHDYRLLLKWYDDQKRWNGSKMLLYC